MIMATDKRKSTGNVGTPSKFAKNQQGGRSPGAGPPGKFGKKPNFPGKTHGTPPQQQGKAEGKSGSPPKQQHQKQQQQQPQKKKNNKQPKPDTPPPSQGGKSLELNEVGKSIKQSKVKKGKVPLDKVAKNSVNIHKRHAKKNRYQRIQEKFASKPQPAGSCERAVKAEQELGHGGHAYTVKLADLPLTKETVEGWSSAIESVVFKRPMEPRHFLIVLKNDVNIKKEIEKLRKVTFNGAKITVEEKQELDNSTPVDNIDPFSLYLTNLHLDVTKEQIKAIFPKSTAILNPRKHNPKFGTPSKYTFVYYDLADDALAEFKNNYNKSLSGNTLVMRFRRQSKQEAAANTATKKIPTPAVAKPVKKEIAKKEIAKKEIAKKEITKKEITKKEKQPVKAEPESDDDEEEMDDDSGEDDEPLAKGMAGVVEKDEGDEDDDDEEEGDDDDDDDDDDLDEDDEEGNDDNDDVDDEDDDDDDEDDDDEDDDDD